MTGGNKPLGRRELLEAAGVASVAAFAGCTGSTDDGSNNAGNDNNGGGQSSDFMKQAKKIGFTKGWKKRRMTSLDEWPLEKRKQIPPESKQANADAWKNSGAIKSQPWTPPEGWKETAAADVDKIQILNFGSLKYDPATAATHAMFESQTGIELDPLEIVVDQAIPKETAFLQAGKSKPQMFSVVITDSLSSFVAGDHLQPLDPLMGDDAMWEPIQPVAKQTFNYNNHLYAGPNILEGSLIHTRPDLLKEQGVDDATIKKIMDGSWSWDDLETAMKAFEGTGTYAWAYRGSSRVYTMRDFMKMFYQAGGSFVNGDGKVKVNTKAGYTALEKMVEWRDKGWVPNEVVNYGQGDLADGFLSGQFAMVPVFGDLVPKALKKYKKGEQYRPTLTPKGGKDTPNPTRAGIASPAGVSVNTNASTGEKLAAMLYLDARFSHPSAWFEFAVEGNQSYVNKVYDEASQTDAAAFADIRGKQMELNKAEVFPQERAIKQQISQECQRAIAGDIEPKKALDNAQDFINTVLGQ